jgi:phosphoglycolate phosphatase-like HAD superfamily hydrolase
LIECCLAENRDIVSKIHTIIFDLSEVLIAGLLGIEVPLAQQLRVPDSTILPAFGGQLLEELCCARLTEDEYLERVISRQGWKVSPGHLKPIIRRNFHRHVPGMQAVLDRLKPCYELVLLSDHALEWMVYIQKSHSFFAKFGALFFSYELGQTKSDPTTFALVLDALGREAHQCLFVDDSERNVAVAGSAGLPSIRFVGAEPFARQLCQRGLEL